MQRAEMKNLMIANWKMNKNAKEAASFVDRLVPLVKNSKNHEIIICPSFTLLSPVAEKIKNTCISLGAQNLFCESYGAYTGEVSPLMIKEAGCKYAIIGHSERRDYMCETDEMINKKLKAALDNNIIPILCIGESLKQRQDDNTKEVLESQLKNALKGINKQTAQKIIIAYEPLWAIGTGKTPTPVQIQETHLFIKEFLAREFGKTNKMPIIYGGSVCPENIREIMMQDAVSGVLVGNASLDPDKFARIVNY